MRGVERVGDPTVVNQKSKNFPESLRTKRRGTKYLVKMEPPKEVGQC